MVESSLNKVACDKLSSLLITSISFFFLNLGPNITIIYHLFFRMLKIKRVLNWQEA